MIQWTAEGEILQNGFNLRANSVGNMQSFSISFKLYRLKIRLRFRNFAATIFEVNWRHTNDNTNTKP